MTPAQLIRFARRKSVRNIYGRDSGPLIWWQAFLFPPTGIEEIHRRACILQRAYACPGRSGEFVD